MVYSGIDLQPHETSGVEHVNGNAGPLVGLVGRITRWKGQDIFLRAAAKVLERFPAAS